MDSGILIDIVNLNGRSARLFVVCLYKNEVFLFQPLHAPKYLLNTIFSPSIVIFGFKLGQKR